MVKILSLQASQIRLPPIFFVRSHNRCQVLIYTYKNEFRAA